MAIEYFCCYHSYIEAMEPLNDAEKGRLFMACLTYSKLGEVPQLSGNERFVFPAIKAQIDRDNAKYKTKCEKQAANEKKRWDAMACDGMPTDAKHAKTKEKEKEKEKEKTKDNISPLPPLQGERPVSEPDLSGMSTALQEKVKQWLDYKRERRESYKPSGLTALLSQIRRCAAEHGETDICELIDYSMSSGYKGILFDRLPKKTAAVGNTAKAMGYGGTMGSLEQEAIKRMLGGNGNE